MTIRLLDAIGLASLDEPSRRSRLAALWCREFDNQVNYSLPDLSKWIRRNYGNVASDLNARDILIEVKRQARIRRERSSIAKLKDPLTTNAGSFERLNHLVNSRLGPPREWSGKISYYLDISFHSGLIAGLIPTTIHLRRILKPRILIYQHKGGAAGMAFVPTHINSVSEAFNWLIPVAAKEFLLIAGSRIEHNGRAQTVTIFTAYGEKTLPWRCLVSD